MTGENYVQVFKDVAAANPDVKLYGPDGVAEEAFTDPAKGGIPADVGARTKITVATLGLEEFKKRNNAEAEKFFKDYEAEYGGSARTRTPSTATRRWRWPWPPSRPLATRPTTARRSGASCSKTPRTAQSALGVYSIDENGDTTLTDYGLYTIKDGQPTFKKVIKAQAG